LGHSVLVLGEAGSGKAQFARALFDRFAGECDCAIATYKGSGKDFFCSIAEQLGIPTSEPKYNKDGDEVGEKAMTLDKLKKEIAANLNAKTLLILPESKRLTTGVRYWLEDLMSVGVRVVCFAVVNPQRDIFLDMIEIELELPDDARIREVMQQEAQRQGLQISRSRLAELQPLAGRNPMLARKVIRNEKLGLKQEKVEHTQYIVIMPVLIAMLFLLAIVRFVGMGTGDKGLYITGGVALVVAMALKQLGQVRGARKRFGQ
jgi:hypothetical protein